jgi:hypothetical protein
MNIRQNIIAEYSADKDKTDKSKNVISSPKLKNCPFLTFLSREKSTLSSCTGIAGRNAHVQNRNVKLLNTTFIVVGRFALVVVGRIFG